MLKQEEILKRLEGVKKVKPWIEARADRLNKVSPAAREIGFMLMGCDPSGKVSTNDQGQWRHRHRAAERLKELSADELVALGESLFPKFPDVFRAAWDMHARLPVQVDYARKPFRAPHRPDLIIQPQRGFIAALITALEGYDEDLPWIAAHAAHIAQYRGAEDLGVLLAAAIDLGGTRGSEVEAILRESAAGTHEVGQFGRHVTGAFLCSSRPDCWEFIEKMLLAAQRQEGLRQTILESIDFSHPDAFRRMLRCIDENNLVRFSATVRAADVWFALQLDSAAAKYVDEILTTTATFLDDDTKRDAALSGDDAEKAFFALWTIAFSDAPAAVAPAVKLLSHKKPETRFIALRLLDMLQLKETYAPIVSSIDDEDIRVATYATAIVSRHLYQRMSDARLARTMVQPRERHINIPPKDSGDVFERLERLLARTPEKPKAHKHLVWPWLKVETDAGGVADTLVVALGERSPAVLLPYLKKMSPTARGWTANLLGLSPNIDATCRAALLELVGDASGNVREAAVEAMRKAKIAPEDLPALEPLLARKASDLRRGVLSLIMSCNDTAAVGCAGRLIASKAAPQRLAGLDLLTQLKEKDRAAVKVGELAESFKAGNPSLSRDEQVYLEKLSSSSDGAALTLNDALGLMDATKRTPPPTPKSRGTKMVSAAAVEILKMLDELVHQNREETITTQNYGGETQQQPLGSLRWGLTVVQTRARDRKGNPDSSWKQPLENLPLKDLWFNAWKNRPASAKDADGFEIARAAFACSFQDDYRSQRMGGWKKDVLRELSGGVEVPKLRYLGVVRSVIDWILAYDMPRGLADFSLDALETLYALIPADKLTATGQYSEVQFRQLINDCEVIETVGGMAKNEGQWTAEHDRRMFGLKRWQDEPLGINATGAAAKIPRNRIDPFAAFEAGFANEHDIMDSLLGPREVGGYGAHGFGELAHASQDLRRGKLTPRAQPLVQRAIDRVLEIELMRGELETPATHAALGLRYAGGSDVLIRVLQAIGKDPKLQRNYAWGEASKGKSVVFSHLIRATFPTKDLDTPESFAAAVKAAGIEEDSLLAVAFYAPQWARFIEKAVDWPLFDEAVWWIHAHTKDSSWRVDRDTREGWNADIRKLTPLTLEDLVEGGVDVDWFHRVHEALGPKRWTKLDDFAKYASGGGGHKRAQLFADGMLGRAKRTALIADITRKRKQDAVRALGLLPIDRKDAKKDILSRYKVIQEFVRGSRQFGSQRQASEKLAARIGQENLARTAGYPDPVRLQWAMEGLSSADLAKGPVVVKVKDIEVSLAIDSDGLPEVSVARKGKALKAIPPEAKKNPKVAELQERKTDLRRSASRMRQSLELAMCRGDRFNRDELIELMGNIVLRPMLERLVFVGDGVAGYPHGGGKVLRDHAGKAEPIKKDEVLRLAHPVDFLKLKQWTKWQHDCFATERVQPFKQIFRELYVITDQEKSDATFSRRYAGQQVNPRQAMALLGSRGWVAAPEAGVFRTFHDEKMVAWLEFMETFYTPAEVEGLTVEKVRFAARGGREYAKMADLPPRLFSEVMRDVDLIVAVAHRGAVDPEASASTVQLRSSLLRETMQLLKLDNVTIKEPHVHIKGSLAEYSVHLGSATTHMLPGGTLFIIPVHSQHRGRIFLPFADDDPKTAEIISKVMLLVRDNEIRDPNLLDQIRVRSA